MRPYAARRAHTSLYLARLLFGLALIGRRAILAQVPELSEGEAEAEEEPPSGLSLLFARAMRPMKWVLAATMSEAEVCSLPCYTMYPPRSRAFNTTRALPDNQ
jgi:hypothetical protein